MIMRVVLLSLVVNIVAAQMNGNVVHTGSYMALFQSHIRDSAYSIYFKLLRPIAYETIEARLLFSNYTRGSAEQNVTKASGSLSLSSGKQEGTITLQIPDDIERHGKFEIYIRGSGILNFENLTSVYVGYITNRRHETNDFIFIQTDKAVYKTGQKVRYRVFVVDRDMKPKDPVMTIDILDPRHNKIKEHVNVSSPFGVSGDLQLSEQPNLGFWTIRVNLPDTDKTDSMRFEVREYVLPKYEVSVKLPPFGTVDNPQLKGTVTAKFTYGKPVTGHVTLRVTQGDSYWKFYEPRAIQTEFEIDGEADFSIATDTLLKLDPTLKYDTLTVEANVTEKETGEFHLARSSVTFHERPLLLEFQTEQADIFKPGFKYTTYIKVTQPDGRPLVTSGDRVRISVTYFTDKESAIATPFRAPNSLSSSLMTFISPFPEGNVMFMPEMFLSIPRDGMVKLELDIPVNVATGHINVRLRDEQISKNIQRFRTAGKTYLHVEMKSSNVKVGKQAEFSVRSNVRPSGKVTYHIMQDSQIIGTHYTHIGSVYQKNTFYVTMTSEMVPRCTLLAYFYDDKHSEIIADAIRFHVDMSFQNDVSLRFDRSQVSPGTNVSLNIRADPGSRVFVLAVDKSVILHKTGNDITKQKVYSKLGIVESSNWKYQDSYLYERVAANDAIGIFNGVGLSVMTDASLYDFDFWNSRHVLFAQTDSMECSGPSCHNSMGTYQIPHTVRKDFPETWMWSNESISSTGNVVMTATIPDTITNWVATAFALNKNSGLGVAPVSANVTAYLPFFVSLHLPFSIVSGEVVVIQALVYNYYPHDLYVTVSLKNSTDEFLGIVVNKYGQEEETKDRVEKCILVKSDDVSSAYFTVKALQIGTIDMEVEASSQRGRDTVLRQLIVRPPGQQEEQNIPILILLENGGHFQHDIPITYPLRIVPGSQRLQITVIGDIFGPSLDHLDQLIKIPYGCGEQNMVRFAPAIFAAKYLKVTNRYSQKIKERIQHVMETGYQRQLTYQRHDGSFSAFGTKDSVGSLWLTAFVLKSFAQASEFTYIDPDIVEKGVKFILGNQNKDGSFNTTGFVHHKAMQGGSSSSSKSLAAYVLIALNEVQDQEIMTNMTEIDILRKAILSAWSFVHQSSSRLTGEYEITIAAYATAQMGRGGSTELLDKLANSSLLVQSDGTKHWQNDVKTVEVETAAYALLAYSKLNNVNGALPVLKWLIRQRSPYGGFISTQDTVVALQAFADIASQMYNDDVSMTIKVDHGSENAKNVTLTAENMDVLQFIDVPEDIRTLRITADGRGTGLVEVSIFYNILNEERDSNFDLMVTTNASDVDKFTLKVCIRWLSSEDSGMVLLDIGFPSGYKPIVDGVPWKVEVRYPSRREMEHERLVLYYDYLDEEITCHTVYAVRESTIGRSQPASVRVYSYYDTDKSAMKFYLPNTLKKNYVCDFCGLECGCGFDPEAVPMERCTGIWSNYRSAVRPVIQHSQPEAHTDTNIIQYPGKPNTQYPGHVKIQYPGRSQINYPVERELVHRVVEPLHVTSMGTIRQRLQPNRWHRGQTVPVSFSRSTQVKQSVPVLSNRLSNRFPTISRRWSITRS